MKYFKKIIICSIISLMGVVDVMACTLCMVTIRGVEYAIITGDEVIDVYINNQKVYFETGQALLEDGRTLVPLRSVLEIMGYNVNWDNDVWSKNNSKDTLIKISSGINKLNSDITILRDNTIMQNGKIIESEITPKMVNGNYYIPLRVIAEATGATVNWDNDNKRIDINFHAESAVNSTNIFRGEVNINESNITYTGDFGIPDPVNNPMSAKVGGIEAVNMGNYNHNIYYENAKSGNSHNIPKGAYYINTNNAVIGLDVFPISLGGVNLQNNKNIFIGESKSSIESKLGSGIIIDGDYSYSNNGVTISYDSNNNVKSITVECITSNGYANKGFSYGTGNVYLGMKKGEEKLSFGESYLFGGINFSGIYFGKSSRIKYTYSSVSGSMWDKFTIEKINI